MDKAKQGTRHKSCSRANKQLWAARGAQDNMQLRVDRGSISTRMWVALTEGGALHKGTDIKRKRTSSLWTSFKFKKFSCFHSVCY